MLKRGFGNLSYEDFDGYLKNYYDYRQPLRFIQDVVREQLGKSIVISSLKDLAELDASDDRVQRLASAIYEYTKFQKKGLMRSEEENRKVAHTDAYMYIAVYLLNVEKEMGQNRILSGTHFIVSSASKAWRSARSQGFERNITARPDVLDLILRRWRVAGAEVQELSLFENPFLNAAMSSIWKDVKPLAEAGVILTERQTVRLRWDLEEKFFQWVTGEKDSSASQSTLLDMEGESSLIKAVRELKKKGYTVVKELDTLLEAHDELAKELNAKNNENRELTIALEKFSKRKQNYLKRIAPKGNDPKSN